MKNSHKKESDNQKAKYRFSGIQPTLITLDETGPSYLVVPPHPEYASPQPIIWTPTNATLHIKGRIKGSE